jgi:hypothetical protein
MTREQIDFLNALLSDAKITRRDQLVRLNFTITRDMLAAAPTRTTSASAPAAKPPATAHTSNQ